MNEKKYLYNNLEIENYLSEIEKTTDNENKEEIKYRNLAKFIIFQALKDIDIYNKIKFRNVNEPSSTQKQEAYNLLLSPDQEHILEEYCLYSKFDMKDIRKIANELLKN